MYYIPLIPECQEKIEIIFLKRGEKMSLGEKLRDWRKNNKISQKDIGEKLEVDQKQISNYENGKSNPSLEGFITICQLMGVSADWLLFDKEYDSLREDEKEMLKIYNGLNDKNKQKLIGKAELILEEQEESDSTTKTAIS